MAKGRPQDSEQMQLPAGDAGVDSFTALLRERGAAFFERVLTRAFDTRRDFLVHEVANKLRLMGLSRSDAVAPAKGAEGDGAWVEIESLSRLRSVVGGRFQNIKEKWVGAGFPLREHRGDKGKDFEVDERAWIELSNWILKQGFEARLTPHKPNSLFELKPVSTR